MEKIPMLDLSREYKYMQGDIDEAISNCLAHQKWILGPEVAQLEKRVAEYLRVRHCIGASSGTEALVLSLRAMAIKLKEKEYFDREDEIITTPFTFTATGDAILRAGATPVFLDIDPLTFNLDPYQIEEYLTQNSSDPQAGTPTQNSRVVGIVPVHLYGRACHMESLMSLAKRYSLFVIEDTAQAFGGSWDGNKLGSLGDAGAFSFFPSKNLGGFGDGGMVATNDDVTAQLVRTLTKHGGKDKYNVQHVGYNARLDTFQAAVLLAKMSYVEEFNERRRRLAAIYSEALRDIDEIVLPEDDLETETHGSIRHVYHQYTIRVSNGRRDALQRHLAENHVDTMVYYPVPLHKMLAFAKRSASPGRLMNAEKAAEEVISLPMEPLLSCAEIRRVIDTVKAFFSLSKAKEGGEWQCPGDGICDIAARPSGISCQRKISPVMG